jgi:hypothetical protein
LSFTRSKTLYKNLDTTILQSKTVRYIIEVLDKLYNENQSKETNHKVEYILREFLKADNIRLNKIGRPLNNEKATNIQIKSRRDYNTL